MASRVATAVRTYGPRAAIVDCEFEAVIPLASALQNTGMFHEVVPAELSVLVPWTPCYTVDELHGMFATVDISGAAPVGRLVEIPTIYDGPDLEDVAERIGCTVAEVIRMHSERTYLAAFAGFAPGFMYCTGLDEQLRIPRRDTPRTSVPAGSVAIADVYTSIYPVPSPGGWNLIGRTDVQLFDLHAQQPALIRPGDRVSFVVRTP